jgi:uncharacterized membrane protein
VNEPGDESVFQVERAISALLRIGVTASLVLISAGTLLSFVQAGGYGRRPADLGRLIGREGGFHRTAAATLQGLVHLDGQAVIVAGLLLLILTPIVRVGISIWAFARERNGAYVVITTVVFLLLLLSFALGRAG